MTADGPPAAPPVFAAPWEAQIFAIVVTLHGKGLFAWSEFAERLGRAIHDPDGPDRAQGYWGDWLAAAVALLADKGLLPPDALARTARRIERERAEDHHHHPQTRPIAISPARDEI